LIFRLSRTLRRERFLAKCIRRRDRRRYSEEVETCLPAKRAWLVVAMSSTLAGNFTLLGSVANLIVAERARAEGIPISLTAR
jgi:hypothetical protein